MHSNHSTARSTPRLLRLPLNTVIALGVMTAASGLVTATAGTLTDLAFTSNNGNYVNDTIAGNSTSPLAFTGTASVNEPFLNNADSSITLGFGTYYAWSFFGFAQHIGAGTISGMHDGVAFSSAVNFPSALSPSGTILSFTFANGETFNVSAPSVTADRISVVANGGGLVPDGTPDAAYRFVYASASAVPEPGSWAMLLAGAGVLGFIGQRRNRVST